jgi:hypothetical protein
MILLSYCLVLDPSQISDKNLMREVPVYKLIVALFGFFTQQIISFKHGTHVGIREIDNAQEWRKTVTRSIGEKEKKMKLIYFATEHHVCYRKV